MAVVDKHGISSVAHTSASKRRRHQHSLRSPSQHQEQDVIAPESFIDDERRPDQRRLNDDPVAAMVCKKPASGSGRLRMIFVNVKLLDDSVQAFEVSVRACGGVLFDRVCRALNVSEDRDYFGLEYTDEEGTRYWLDYGKRMCDQLGLTVHSQPTMDFVVKFYVPDPANQLVDEYTRYLFSLQIRRDLASGDLIIADCDEAHTKVGDLAASSGADNCRQQSGSDRRSRGRHCELSSAGCDVKHARVPAGGGPTTAALLCSYLVQAAVGDFSSTRCSDHAYLARTRFVPRQTRHFEAAVAAHHRRHVGQSPHDAELNLLEHVRRCELYGVKMAPARDSQNVPLNLAVAHMGLLVLQATTRINTFAWDSIRKLSFRRRQFLIKLHPTEGYGYYKKVEQFTFASRNAAKSFWKRCVEYHGFFRLNETSMCSTSRTAKTRNTTGAGGSDLAAADDGVENFNAAHLSLRPRTGVFSRRGSSFRYSGRTQKQLMAKRDTVAIATLSREADGPSLKGGRRSFVRTASVFVGGVQSAELSAVSAVDSACSEAEASVTSGGLAVGSSTQAQRGRASAFICPPPASTSSPIVEDRLSPAAVGSGVNEQELFRQKKDGVQIEQCEDWLLAADRCSSLQRGFLSQRPTSSSADSKSNSKTHIVKDANANRIQIVTNRYQNELMVHLVDPNSVCRELLAELQQNHRVPASIIESSKRNDTLVSLRRQCLDSLHGASATGAAAAIGAVSPVGDYCDRGDDYSGREYAYCISKELLMTERTYKRDLEIITFWFREHYFDDHKSHARSFVATSSVASSPISAGSFQKNSFHAEATTTDAAALGEGDSIRHARGPSSDGRTQVTRQESVASSVVVSSTTDFVDELLQLLDPLYTLHCRLLRDLEHRIAGMEGRPVTGRVAGGENNSPNRGPGGGRDDGCGLDRLLLEYSAVLSHYATYARRLPTLLDAYGLAFRSNTSFRCTIESFEANSVCYVPLAQLLSRPLHRLGHYLRACARLAELSCCVAASGDGDEVKNASSGYEAVIDQVRPVIDAMAGDTQAAKNRLKLIELDRDLVGVGGGLAGRRFLREGSLLKLGPRGYQQRMFFLFVDCLVYASRCPDAAGLRFRAHAEVPLRGASVEQASPGELHTGGEQSLLDDTSFLFTVRATSVGCKTLVLAAPTELERQRWIAAIRYAIDSCEQSSPICGRDENAHGVSGSSVCSLKSCASSTDDANVTSITDEEDIRAVDHSSTRLSLAADTSDLVSLGTSGGSASAVVNHMLHVFAQHQRQYVQEEGTMAANGEDRCRVGSNGPQRHDDTQPQAALSQRSQQPKSSGGRERVAGRRGLAAAGANSGVQYPRCNTTLHVCWLRQLSIGHEDYERAALSSHQLSGYMLRKFKQSAGWQKLWIVFCDFSLFFYKSYQDTTPLACLPLLGYRVGVPTPVDGIDKPFVLKLHFKSHTYFFRAESHYSFQRWLEAIGSIAL